MRVYNELTETQQPAPRATKQEINMRTEIDVTVLKTTARGLDFNRAIRGISDRLYLVDSYERKGCTVLLVGGLIGNLKEDLIVAVSGIKEDIYYKTVQKAELISQIISEEELSALELTEEQALAVAELEFY